MARTLKALFLLSLIVLTAAAPVAPVVSLPTASTQSASRPALLPPPDAAAQARARQMIHALFKEEFARPSAADRRALALHLETEALATRDDLTARYVLLSDASDLAAGAGDAAVALRTLEERAHTHAGALLEAQHQALLHTGPQATTPEAAEALARVALDLAETAAMADAFDITNSLLALAESSANRTKHISFVASVQPRLADLRDLAAEFARVQDALKKLQTAPDDADAHLAAGRFYALSKGDFVTGLPHLAKCADPALRALAAKELAPPAEPLQQVELADGWWDYAAQETGRTRANIAHHAQSWYRTASANISGITLTRIAARLKSTDPSPDAATRPAASTIEGHGENLLALIDPARDAVAGKWTLADGVLGCDASHYARLQIPCELPDEFDLRMSFTRTDGDGPIALLLHARGQSFGLCLDIKGEARIERVSGKIAKDNPTVTPIAITNGRRYRVIVEVRKDRITALLDDNPLLEWKTDFKDLSRYAPWKLAKENLSGIGANNAQVTFHSIELIPISAAPAH